MRKTSILLSAALLCIAPVAGFAQSVDGTTKEELIETVRTGCQKEIQQFCKEVTPGEGRVLACLYAREDKLSGQCEYALYDASEQLNRVVSALSYLAGECEADLQKFCANVETGEGRVIGCLDEHRPQLTKRCQQALETTHAKPK